MPFLANDAAVFLGDFGVPVDNPCGQSTTGILRQADMEESGLIRRRTVLRIQTGTAGTLVESDTDPDVELLVGGVRYRVDYTLLVDDGLFTDIVLGGEVL
jgi:hypothetical protein